MLGTLGEEQGDLVIYIQEDQLIQYFFHTSLATTLQSSTPLHNCSTLLICKQSLIECCSWIPFHTSNAGEGPEEMGMGSSYLNLRVFTRQNAWNSYTRRGATK